MLHDVQFGPFAEQPAGKATLPFAITFEREELDERAGICGHFPSRGLFAGTQAHHGTANADGFARLHFKVTHNAVALVQQADHGDALGHRRGAFEAPLDILDLVLFGQDYGR